MARRYTNPRLPLPYLTFPVRLLRFSLTRCTLGFPKVGDTFPSGPTVGAPLQHWRQHGSVTDAKYFHTVMMSSTQWIQGTNQTPGGKREKKGGATGGHVDIWEHSGLTAMISDYIDDATPHYKRPSQYRVSETNSSRHNTAW